MTCDEVIQYLPWRLNGSLTVDENAAIDAHVASCVRCREARADVGFMLHATATSHPTVDELTLVAFGKANEAQRSRVADHVALCGPCTESLAMAEQSAREAAQWVQGEGSVDDETPRAAASAVVSPAVAERSRWRPGVLQAAVLAVMLAAVAVLGWGWRAAHLTVTAESAQRATAVTALASRDDEIQRVRDRADQLEMDADARARDAIRGLDLEAMDTVHVQTLMSGGNDDAARVTRRTPRAGVRLSIQGSLSWPATVGVEVRDATDRLVALRLNLPRSNEGPYQVPIPPTWLEHVQAGDTLTVEVFDDQDSGRQVLETYTVRWPFSTDAR